MPDRVSAWSVICYFRTPDTSAIGSTVKIRIQYALLYNMHPQLQRENHGKIKILVQVYSMLLFYATRYKLVH